MVCVEIQIKILKGCCTADMELKAKSNVSSVGPSFGSLWDSDEGP